MSTATRPQKAARPLKVGYVMQTHAPEMSEVSGPQLHVKSFVQVARRRGHDVRMVAIQKGEMVCSDDLVNWQPIVIRPSRLFRIVESTVRSVQNRLHLPFIRLFDSIHFAEACCLNLASYEILYERYGLLNYGGLIAARRMNVPIILEVNGDIVEEYAQLGIRLSRAQWEAIHLITRKSFASASHIITVDEGLKQRMIRRWNVDASKITVITNGTDFELFSRPHDPQYVREKHDFGNGQIVAYVGGFKPWHGVDVLVKAYKRVHDLLPDTLLVLMGDGPERPSAVELAGQLGLGKSVVFMGQTKQEDVAEVLSISEVVTAPYRNWSGVVGMKTFDYMATGKGIISSSENGGHPILKHMHTALLVEPENIDQLADAMLLLLREKELCTKLGANAQLEVSRTHTWDTVLEKVEAICMGLLGERN